MAKYERVSVTAKRYRVTTQAVYNWLKSGEIEGFQDPDTGAWKVVAGAKVKPPETRIERMIEIIDECL